MAGGPRASEDPLPAARGAGVRGGVGVRLPHFAREANPGRTAGRPALLQRRVQQPAAFSLTRGHAPTCAWGITRIGVSACLLSRRGGAEVPPRQPAPGNTCQETRKRHMVFERWIARRGQRNSRVGSIRRRLVAPGLLLLCLATLALGTCDSPPDPQTTIRTDSAGIPITTALAP